MNITANERALLLAICHNDFLDGRHPVDSDIWVDCISGWSDTKKYGGVMASLVQKKLVRTDGETCCITQAGFDIVANEVNLG